MIPVQYGHTANKQAKTLLIIGDSLSAGYGINVNNGWVNLLRQRLKNNGYNINVINASISGDTSQSAKTRLADNLAVTHVDYLIIEIGGNDGLRGFVLKAFKKNMQTMIDLAIKKDIKVLLLGMKIPPNYGPFYSQAFERVYLQLSDENSVSLVPFFLSGVAEDQSKMQHDGLHPKEASQILMLDNTWNAIKTMVSE